MMESETVWFSKCFKEDLPFGQVGLCKAIDIPDANTILMIVDQKDYRDEITL